MNTIRTHRTTIFTAVFTLLLAGAAFAEVPKLINYQGYLTDRGGTPTTDTLPMIFSLYDAETGGTLLWTETWGGVSVNEGVFNVLLGSTTTLGLDFSSDYWLETTVDGELLNARHRLVSVGYAFRAEYANSATETDPVFTAWDKSTDISITESQISDLTHFTTADETDPQFTTWDKSTGVSITESQISDLSHFTTGDEEDPIWTGVSGNYYTITNMQTSGQSQLHWDNLASVPTGFADGVDNTGVDGLWAAGTGDDIHHENGNVGIGDTDVTSKLKVTNLDETQAALLMQQQAEYDLFLEAAGGTAAEYARSVSETSDGGCIVAGETRSFGAGGDDVFLLKYDGGGALAWAKTAGGTGFDTARSVTQTSDGGYIVSGDTSNYGAGGGDIFLLKYDGGGNLTWAKTTGETDDEYGRSVSETSDGGYIVAGSTASYGSGDYDVFLLKYDGGGNLTWAKTVGEIDDEDEAYSVSETSDGGCIVAGFTASYGAGSNDILLLRTDGSGDITGCAPCTTVSPSTSTPTPSTGAPSPSTNTPSPSTGAPSPSTDAPSPSTSVECTAVGSALQDVLVVSNDAKVGIGTTSPTHLLHVDGVARSAWSTWATSSDGRVKTDIRPLNGSLDKIRRLNPVTFEYIPAYRGDNEALAGRKTGFIAQEVATVDPGMVSTVVETFGGRTIEDFRTLNNGNMIPMLVDALKEQQVQIGKLKAENEGLKAEKNKEIGELKQVVCELKPDAAICRPRVRGSVE